MVITVTRKSPKERLDAFNAKYSFTCDQLPGEVFGPYDFRELRNELFVLAGMGGFEVRNLILDAWIRGTASNG